MWRLVGVVAAAAAAAAGTLALTSTGHAGTDSSHPRASPAPQLRLVWAEEFNGSRGSPPGPSHWNFDVGGTGWGDQELQSNTPRSRNAELDGRGHLAITARAERFTGPEGLTRSYTSARLETLKKFEFEYGLAEARIAVPAGAGLLPQFWLLGTNAYHPGAWPACGEIDAMEIRGSAPSVLKGTLHGPWPSEPHGIAVRAVSPVSLAAAFHTYGVKWEPDSVQFLLDGSVYATLTPADLPPGAAWPFRHRFFLLLDLVVGGTAAGPPAPSTPFPARMLVDWVRVWQWPATPARR